MQWRDHDVGALLMLTKQKWNQMDGDGRWYCDAAELRQLSRSQGGHNGDPCPAWHHDTSRVGFLNFYIDTFMCFIVQRMCFLTLSVCSHLRTHHSSPLA